ncbi:MAG: hypothetical protein ACREOU_11845 [Candidatus Eiseniibacteriota bacterium]
MRDSRGRRFAAVGLTLAIALLGSGCASWRGVKAPLSAQLEEGKHYARARGTTLDGRAFAWQDAYRSGETLYGRTPLEAIPGASNEPASKPHPEPLQKEDLTRADSLQLSEIQSLEVATKTRDKSAAELAIIVVLAVSMIFIITLNN